MDIEERVARLERKNRNLILAVVFIGGFFWIRQMSPVPSVIEAKSFRVIGGEGQVLALMGVDSEGDGIVKTRNANGVWESL